VVTSVHNLDQDALVDILTTPKNALVKQYRKFFEFDGVELVFTDDALEAISDQSMLRGTGARGLRAILDEYRPTLVALEEIFTAPRHPRSALLMAHMRGVICLLLEEAGVPILPLTATTVKQRLTGSGHASKEQVQRMVLQLTGLAPDGRLRLDETDAIALALAGLSQTGVGGRPLPRSRSRPRLPPWIEAARV
jgi:crossover junction endodeoxyribonuclease RuvC